MPNLENIRKWHDALLSGQYQQTIGRLRRTTLAEGDAEANAAYPLGHCCLGVACDLAAPDAWGMGSDDFVHGYGSDNVLSPPALEWLDIEQDDPLLKVPEHLREKEEDDPDGDIPELSRAITLNDAEGFTFAQIAACIRETWPQAFES